MDFSRAGQSPEEDQARGDEDNAANRSAKVRRSPVRPARGPSKRQVVDYSLQRRALLREVYANRVGVYEACDASPYLKTAARFHGEKTELRCPVCRRENLVYVHYIYGEELKHSAGQARRRSELALLAATFREFQVYVVEVCQGCGWNHLVEQYLLGKSLLGASAINPVDANKDGEARRSAASPRRRHATGFETELV
ncbi:MAG: DUF5318 domain-containing protein [Longispora sp.]|nr:DUF5318 domain-containing protein [Longispora sp. (in: high G+C Gram-positive bacteria)]